MNYPSPGSVLLEQLIKPLKISRNKVNAAINLLPVLSTFVAPIFFDPISLISFFKKNLVKINPKGIEPNIYDVRNTKNISNITVS